VFSLRTKIENAQVFNNRKITNTKTKKTTITKNAMCTKIIIKIKYVSGGSVNEKVFINLRFKIYIFKSDQLFGNNLQ
jgi:hypothetical protein